MAAMFDVTVFNGLGCKDNLVGMPSASVQLVADIRCSLGENPLWHSEEQKLYWCDISKGCLHRYDPSTGTTETIRDGSKDQSQIGGFTIEADGALLLFMDKGRVARWSGNNEIALIDSIPREKITRFNDVIADKVGRVFCGTMSTESRAGRLYRVDLDGSLHVIASEVKCANGLAFSRDGKRLFFTDSFAHTIYVFEYDSETGRANNQRPFLKVNPTLGLPDGLTIDAEGYFWCAIWGGGCVLRYDPSGRESLRIPIPVPKVSSLTFGEADLRTLFITTAGGDLSNEREHAGGLFALRLDVAGVPEFRSRIYADAAPASGCRSVMRDDSEDK